MTYVIEKKHKHIETLRAKGLIKWCYSQGSALETWFDLFPFQFTLLFWQVPVVSVLSPCLPVIVRVITPVIVDRTIKIFKS